MEQFLLKSQNFSGCEEKGGEVEEQAVFEQEGEQWETDQSEECLSFPLPPRENCSLIYTQGPGRKDNEKCGVWMDNKQTQVFQG